ncbi:hypothetical protein [Candidatus Laterigemmans baculatus]|uniref:hypothetical protein n=1 Tax=Candidatus Laterigemmans baculatus TaxID=2770505 RepID=UPI0013DB697C|nr:hypothetical protein [Candidatus Laterigemmans baculatus]
MSDHRLKTLLDGIAAVDSDDRERVLSGLADLDQADIQWLVAALEEGERRPAAVEALAYLPIIAEREIDVSSANPHLQGLLASDDEWTRFLASAALCSITSDLRHATVCLEEYRVLPLERRERALYVLADVVDDPRVLTLCSQEFFEAGSLVVRLAAVRGVAEALAATAVVDPDDRLPAGGDD